MATATKTRTPAADAAAAVAGGKAKGAPAARSGTQHVDMPEAAVFQRFGEFMAGVITPLRARILWRLAGGPCAVAALAETLGKTPNGISVHLKGLRLLGLIEAAEGEGRGKSYSLTKGGLAWFKRLRPCLEPFAGGT